MPLPYSRVFEFNLTDNTIALLNDQWIAADELSISMSDVGFRQGVTAVERLRTYQRRVFQRDAHLDRWRHTINQLGIVGLPEIETIEERIAELIRRNQRTLDAWRETGLTIIATPGPVGCPQPTFAMHLNRLDLDANHQRQVSGQQLVVTDIVQPPPESWSRQIKVRCRLHYYLADHQALAVAPGARGVLLDGDQTITETSVANIAIVQSGQLISPPVDRVLRGITQTVVEELAAEHNLAWQHRPITIDQLIDADEVLLMGTDGGIWFSHLVNDQPIAAGRPGKIYLQLKDAFDRLVSK